MPSALAKASQRGFGSGMWQISARDRIPETGAWNLENCLIATTGEVYRRSGTSYLTGAFGSAGLTFLWDGILGGQRRTIVAREGAFGAVSADDSSITSIGGDGLHFPVRPAVVGRHLYLRDGVRTDGGSISAAKMSADLYTAAGGKLIACIGKRIYMSAQDDPETFDSTEYHELPEGVRIIGAEGTRDRLAVFTTQGVWLVSNIELDLTDADGNVQQSLDRFSRDMVLWADAGIAGWQGGLVVPAMDGVWLMAIGQDVVTGPPPFRRISEPIDPLYREYVRVGYRPGGAVVYRGHYFLPILNGPSVVDLLVCKLESGAWTRFSGHGGYLSQLAVRASYADRPQVLLGAQRDSSSKVSALNYFDPPPASGLRKTTRDANSTSPRWEIVTRDYVAGEQAKSLVKKLRAELVLDGSSPIEGPTVVTAAYGAEEPVYSASVLWNGTTWNGGTWQASNEGFTSLSGSAPSDLTGALPYVWRVNKNAERIRFRLRCTVSSGTARLRSLEVHLRPTGRF